MQNKLFKKKMNFASHCKVFFFQDSSQFWHLYTYIPTCILSLLLPGGKTHFSQTYTKGNCGTQIHNVYISYMAYQGNCTVYPDVVVEIIFSHINICLHENCQKMYISCVIIICHFTLSLYMHLFSFNMFISYLHYELRYLYVTIHLPVVVSLL